MKRTLSLLLVTVMILTVFCAIPVGASSALLISVGGKAVTEDMTLSDVIALFGEPQLETASFFGGKACTFYGENYDDYLYIETFADGTIASYGSVSDDFVTNGYSYGDTPDNIVRQGKELTRSDGTLFGVLRYRNYPSGKLNEWFENAAVNNRGLCEHAVELWNAVSYLYGYNTPTVFDERTFYTNMQLADNNSSLYEYCRATSQDDYFQLITTGVQSYIGMYYYPNPFMFGRDATRIHCTEGFVSGFICYQKNGYTYALSGFVDPTLYKEKTDVPYTAEEQALLEAVRESYAQSVAMFNEGAEEGYYTVEPQYETLPLTAGVMNEKVLRGAIDYLNTIRIGAGLPTLTYSAELSESAQYKATLTMYISANGISNPNPHNPAKPDGVDEEFYQKTQLGNGENLFMCGIIGGNVVGSLRYALSDAYGSGQYYLRGHRYNLLNPYYTEIGVANTGNQGVHKMSGYAPLKNVEVVAWPSKGIMIEETGLSSGEMLSCVFYNGYRTNDETVVTVECLNTGESWVIAKDTLTDGQAFWTNGSQISYADETIPFIVGHVYRITFDKLLDENGNTVSYSYRSVFEKAYLAGENAVPQAVTLDREQLTMVVGDTQKLTATITPAEAENKMVYWSSSDETVATVNENGFVTACGNGTVTITAVTEEGNHTASCTVTVIRCGTGDVNLDGIVSLPDAVQLFYHINGMLVLTDAELAEADVEPDGTVNLQDAVCLFYRINGITE